MVKMNGSVLLTCLLALSGTTKALNNGLALTPPMGWLAWERFRCNTNCQNDPENCISEHLFKKMTDLLVSEGYVDAGYDLISLDDCWLSHDRDTNGKLQPDPERFPSGIKGLADYVHSKGMKFGIYEDYGTHTCAGYPGVLGHLKEDAETFAEWGVDYVKLDGCNVDPKEMDEGYPEFGRYLNETGRPMIYSCEWPWYQRGDKLYINYTAISDTCNLWRNNEDMQDAWSSVTQAINFYGDHQDEFAQFAGPGGWNDPDELIVGNFGLSYEQSKAQMAMWSIMASPLLMSVDLRTIDPKYKDIIQNRDVIAIDQDPLGIQGRRVKKQGSIEIWTKPIIPSIGNDNSYAVVILSQSVSGTPTNVTISLGDLGMTHQSGYSVTDIYSKVQIGSFNPKESFYVMLDTWQCPDIYTLTSI